MASSRKKKEKKKDFQKRKLRVGKTAARPDNHTDTSFTAKAISLPSQSLARAHPDRVDLSHHLLLTKHHSAATRKEVLAYIEAHLPANPSLYKQILTLTVLHVTDPSHGVRLAFVSLLAACARRQPGLLELHMRSIVLFVHSAMSHLLADVRATSSAVLRVLLDHAAPALVKGHFVRTLRSYFALMAWTLSGDKKAVSVAANAAALGGGSKARVAHLAVLQRFLAAALLHPAHDPASAVDWAATGTVHPQTCRFMLPSNPQAYAPLQLFVPELPSHRVDDDGAADDGAYSLHDVDHVSTEDQATRWKIMRDVFMAPLRKNLAAVVREGGEPGKEAHACLATLLQFEDEYAKAQDR